MENELKDCCCGCGKELDRYDNRNRERKYLHGHNVDKLGKPGHPAWNKGLKGLQPWMNLEGLKKGHGWNKGKPNTWSAPVEFTDEIRKKMSSARIGKEPWNKGKYLYHLRGENHPNWKGGLYTSERMALMAKLEYRQWRTAVFERDNFTCQICKIKGGNLEADHIVPYYVDKDKALEIDNGRTLCRLCHQKTPTWGKGVYNYENLRLGKFNR